MHGTTTGCRFHTFHIIRIAAGIGLAAASSGRPSYGIDLETVAAFRAAQDALIRSVSVTYTVAIEQDQIAGSVETGGLPVLPRATWAWREPAEYASIDIHPVREGAFDPMRYEFAFDGVRSRERYTLLGGRRVQGVIRDGNVRGCSRYLFPGDFLFQVDDLTTVPEFLASKATSLSETKAEDGRSLVNVRGTSFIETVDLQLDPERGFAMARMRSADEISIVELEVLDYTAVDVAGTTIHFPSRGLRRTYDATDGSLSWTEEYAVLDFAINSGLDDSLFSLVFQPGTWVTDQELSFSYPIPGFDDDLP